MTPPVLSLVTGTRNRPDDFRRLVDSVDRYTSVSWELVVSDASDTPIENEAVATRETWPQIRVIPERPRLGCTLGYNRAFRAATGEWVIWLNDDCVVESGYADEAIGFMLAHPSVGLGAIPYREPTRANYMVNSYFGMIYANFGILKRELGNEIGWFDEELPMYGNDNSLAFRVLLAGRGIAEVVGARIFHFATADQNRRNNNSETQRHRDVNVLIAKYGPQMDLMRQTYVNMGGTKGANEQTPDWARAQLR